MGIIRLSEVDSIGKSEEKKGPIKTPSYEYFSSLKSNECEDDYDRRYKESMNALISLGFPSDTNATEYFADLVTYCKKIIDENSDTREGLLYLKQFIKDLGDSYTSPHLYVSREVNWIGCKSFHECIRDQFLELKQENSDNKLFQNFCIHSNEADETCQGEIGIIAFIIASYMDSGMQNKSFEKNVAKRVRTYNKQRAILGKE